MTMNHGIPNTEIDEMAAANEELVTDDANVSTFRSNHDNLRSYKCRQCDQQFKTKQHLTQHVVVIHGFHVDYKMTTSDYSVNARCHLDRTRLQLCRKYCLGFLPHVEQ